MSSKSRSNPARTAGRTSSTDSPAIMVLGGALEQFQKSYAETSVGSGELFARRLHPDTVSVVAGLRTRLKSKRQDEAHAASHHAGIRILAQSDLAVLSGASGLHSAALPILRQRRASANSPSRSAVFCLDYRSTSAMSAPGPLETSWRYERISMDRISSRQIAVINPGSS